MDFRSTMQGALLEAGVVAWLPKPLTAAQFVRAIQQALAGPGDSG